MQTVVHFLGNNDVRLYILLACKLMCASVHVVIDSLNIVNIVSTFLISGSVLYGYAYGVMLRTD